MISKNQNIKCPWCGSKDKAVNWNDESYKECKSREQRRAFTEIYKERTFSKGANTYYKCTTCGMWSRGSQLIIVDTEDERLLKLGREPIATEVDKI